MSVALSPRQPASWPRSLFSRVMLVLLCGLIAAHALSFALVFYERTQSSLSMMMRYVSRDIASAVAILERVPAEERTAWLPRLERRSFHYRLNGEPQDSALSSVARQLRDSIAATLGAAYPLRAMQSAERPSSLALHTQLSDGMPLTIEFQLSVLPLAPWMVLALGLQLLLLVLFSWLGVRLVTRPLAQLAQAADALGPDLKGAVLTEEGPVEVVHAARAFNAMQRRIAEHLAERMQILASISHDLQTPITRMRLRADLLDDAALREKLLGDLDAMQALVQEGIAYARDGQGVTEAPCRIDLDALLDSLVCDYVDGGRPVTLHGQVEVPVMTRPNALRRIIANLVDNALKFAGAAQIQVAAAPPESVTILVLDQGPGLPEAELERVLQPFYRIESSRNRETGGTGLGLAIARQLTLALGGTLTLSNRAQGGLEARVVLPHSPMPHRLAGGRSESPAPAPERTT